MILKMRINTFKSQKQMSLHFFFFFKFFYILFIVFLPTPSLAPPLPQLSPHPLLPTTKSSYGESTK